MVDAAEKEYNNTSLIKFLMNKNKKGVPEFDTPSYWISN